MEKTGFTQRLKDFVKSITNKEVNEKEFNRIAQSIKELTQDEWLKEFLNSLQGVVNSFDEIKPVTRLANKNNRLVKIGIKQPNDIGMVNIPLPDDFLKMFTFPADCKILACLSVAQVVWQLMKEAPNNQTIIDELFALHAVYKLKAVELGHKFLKGERFATTEEWIKKRKKYAKNKKALKDMEMCVMYLSLLQTSKTMVR